MITKEEYQNTLIRMWDSVRTDDDSMGKPICGGINCDECPIKSICGSNSGLLFSMYDVAELVEKWGKEHPAKTNREVFEETMKEKFGDKINLDVFDSILDEQDCNLINGECHSSGSCSTCDQHDFWDKEYKEVSKDADSN